MSTIWQRSLYGGRRLRFVDSFLWEEIKINTKSSCYCFSLEYTNMLLPRNGCYGRHCDKLSWVCVLGCVIEVKMVFGAIMESWRKAFYFFSKRELGLFVLSWFCTFRRALFVFLKYFSWLAILEIYFFYFLKQHSGDGSLSSVLVYSISIVLNILVAFFAVLSTRASIEAKSPGYFLSQTRKIFGFAVLFIAFCGVKCLVESYISPLLSTFEVGRFMSAFFGGWIIFARVPVVAFVYLFFMDSSGLMGLVSSCVNGLKTVCYFFPVVVLLFFLPILLRLGIMKILVSCFNLPAIALAAIQSGLLPYVIDFLSLCAVATYYLKIKYNNYSLFFH